MLAFIVDIFARKLCSIWSLAIWKGKSNTSYTIQTRHIKRWVTLFSEDVCLKLSLAGKQRCVEQYLAKQWSGKWRDRCALYRAASQWSGWWLKLMGTHTSSRSQQTTWGVQEVPHVTLQCTSRQTQQMYLTNSWNHHIDTLDSIPFKLVKIWRKEHNNKKNSTQPQCNVINSGIHIHVILA